MDAKQKPDSCDAPTTGLRPVPPMPGGGGGGPGIDQEARDAAQDAKNTAAGAKTTAEAAARDAKSARDDANAIKSSKLNNDLTRSDGKNFTGADGDILALQGGRIVINSPSPHIDQEARDAAAKAQEAANSKLSAVSADGKTITGDGTAAAPLSATVDTSNLMSRDGSNQSISGAQEGKLVGFGADGKLAAVEAPKAGAGDMLAAVYDPQGKKADAFKYENLTGDYARVGGLTGAAYLWLGRDSRDSDGYAILSKGNDRVSLQMQSYGKNKTYSYASLSVSSYDGAYFSLDGPSKVHISLNDNIGTSGQVITCDENKNAVWKDLPKAGGGGDMLAAVYDPQGKKADAFDFANMSGSSAVVSHEENGKILGSVSVSSGDYANYFNFSHPFHNVITINSETGQPGDVITSQGNDNIKWARPIDKAARSAIDKLKALAFKDKAEAGDIAADAVGKTELKDKSVDAYKMDFSNDVALNGYIGWGGGGLKQCRNTDLLANDGKNALSAANNGTITLKPANLISSDAGNALTEGSDGKLKAAAGGGDMQAAVYDPQGIEGDAFQYDNFKGDTIRLNEGEGQAALYLGATYDSAGSGYVYLVKGRGSATLQLSAYSNGKNCANAYLDSSGTNKTASLRLDGENGVYISLNGKQGSEGQIITCDEKGNSVWKDPPKGGTSSGWQKLKMNDDGNSANWPQEGAPLITLRDDCTLNPAAAMSGRILGSVQNFDGSLPQGVYTAIPGDGLMDIAAEPSGSGAPAALLLEYKITKGAIYVRQ